MKQAQRYGLAVEGPKAPRVRKRDTLALAVKRALGIDIIPGFDTLNDKKMEKI